MEKRLFLVAKKPRRAKCIFICTQASNSLKGQECDKTWTRKQAFYTMIVITRVKYKMTKQELSLGPINFCHY